MKILTLFIMVEQGYVVAVESTTSKTIALRVVSSKLLAANYVKSLQRLFLRFELVQTWLLLWDSWHTLLVNVTKLRFCR